MFVGARCAPSPAFHFGAVEQRRLQAQARPEPKGTLVTDYHDDPEGPEEIDPAYLAEGKRAEVLLRNPEVYVRNNDGTTTHLLPSVNSLTWSEVPLVADPDNCRHGFSMCAECADDWGIDHYIRFFDGDVCVWLSPDHPDHPDGKA